MNLNPDIAIIVCTYNPDPGIFGRVLRALGGLQGLETAEVVLVDNNSSPPIGELDAVRDFLARAPAARVIREPEQGLSHTRRAGVRATTAPAIVFCDDDNELAPDYLLAARRILAGQVAVACWGPGHVEVEFAGPVRPWVERYTRGIFQQKHVARAEFGCAVGAYPFYPFGSGMVVRREVMDAYERAAAEGGYRTTDRRGGSLAAGGDVQICYTAVKAGRAVGVSPELRLKHLIHTRRTSLRYLCRLLYGCAASGATARIEVFPEYRETIELPGRREFVSGVWALVRGGRWIRRRCLIAMGFAEHCGRCVGAFRALGRPLPRWLRYVAERMGFES